MTDTRMVDSQKRGSIRVRVKDNLRMNTCKGRLISNINATVIRNVRRKVIGVRCNGVELLLDQFSHRVVYFYAMLVKSLMKSFH